MTEANTPVAYRISVIVREKGLKQLYVAEKAGYTAQEFHDHSYGFRPNRCAQQAILTALDMMNEGNDWIVDIDLEKFFDTVNHDKLMTIIGRTIKDGDVISIVRKYLVSGIMIDDEYEDSIVGTPQGGNLSPLLANIMLNELDKEMEKRGLNFVRYADDCIIMVGSEMSANRVMRNISRFIEEKLGLKVNMTKSRVDRPQGLKYLGFGFYFDLIQEHISLRQNHTQNQ